MKIFIKKARIAQLHKSISKIHCVLKHHVATDFFGLSFALQLILSSQVPQNGISLGNFNITIHQIRQIRKIQAQSEFFWPAIRLWNNSEDLRKILELLSNRLQNIPKSFELVDTTHGYPNNPH